MMSLPEFSKKQVVFVFLTLGEKVSFGNDNLIVKDIYGKIRLQCTCYRIYMLCIVGSFTLTSGIIQRSHKFAFPIYLLTNSFKVYDKLGSKMEGNVVLRRKQYAYNSLDLAKQIVINKIENQNSVLISKRQKSKELTLAVDRIQSFISLIKLQKLGLHELLSYEGNSAKIYFSNHFDSFEWNGRKPRIKHDYVNACLDIGYSMLFNFVEVLLDMYGFDVYCGVLHKEFYMRKSLVCDIVEPFRPIIDIQVKKSINLKQFKKEDFNNIGGSYKLKWDYNKKYVSIFLQSILEYKEDIFLYIQSYYRNFMKGNPAELYQAFKLRL